MSKIEFGTALRGLFFLPILAFMGCGGRTDVGPSEVLDRGSNFEAQGQAAYEPGLASETQRKALARDTAIAKARLKLLEFVDAAVLEDGRTVQKASEADFALQAKVEEIVQSADIVKTEFSGDKGCKTTLRLPKTRLEAVMNLKLR